MSVTIYGASDDLIEITGEITEEWSTFDPVVLAMSNGSVWRISYTDHDIWRITPVIVPSTCTYNLVLCASDDDDNYSDRLTVEGVTWVARSTEVAR